METTLQSMASGNNSKRPTPIRNPAAPAAVTSPVTGVPSAIAVPLSSGLDAPLSDPSSSSAGSRRQSTFGVFAGSPFVPGQTVISPRSGARLDISGDTPMRGALKADDASPVELIDVPVVVDTPEREKSEVADKAAVLAKRYDALRVQQEVAHLRQLSSKTREREAELRQFHEDFTLPVTDDVGLALGQLRDLTGRLGVSQLDSLVDQLETALEDQMLVFFRHHHDTLGDAAATDAVGARSPGSGVFAESASSGRLSAGSGAMATSLLSSHGHGTAVPSPRAPPSRGARSRFSNGSTKAPVSPKMPGGLLGDTLFGERYARPPPLPQVLQGATAYDRTPKETPTSLAEGKRFLSAARMLGESGRHSPARSSAAIGIAGAACHSAEFGLSSLPYLIAESLAIDLRCERVRVYLEPQGAPVKRLEHITSFPPEASDPGAAPPQLPRAVASAVYSRAFAVSGHAFRDRTPPPSPTRGGDAPEKPKPKEEPLSTRRLKTDQSKELALMTKHGAQTLLVWPVHVWRDGARVVVGAIECVNKEPPPPSETDVQDVRQFSKVDEATVHTAAKLLALSLQRHGFHKAFCASNAAAIYGLGVLGGQDAPHLPADVDVDVHGAALAAHNSQRATHMTHIFRGPTMHLHRFTAPDRKGDAAPAGIPAPSDLRNVEEALDSLSMMWRTAYEENKKMHTQCRIYATQLREARRVVEQTQATMAQARNLNTVEDMRAYLRNAEMALSQQAARARGARVPPVTPQHVAQVTTSSAVSHFLRGDGDPSSPTDRSRSGRGRASPRGTASPKGSASPKGAASPRSSRGNSPPAASPDDPYELGLLPEPTPQVIAEMHTDGPPGVRLYTVDPPTIRAQQQAIQRLVTADARQKARDEQAARDAVPRFSRPTASRKGKVVERPVDPDAVLRATQPDPRQLLDPMALPRAVVDIDAFAASDRSASGRPPPRPPRVTSAPKPPPTAQTARRPYAMPEPGDTLRGTWSAQGPRSGPLTSRPGTVSGRPVPEGGNTPLRMFPPVKK